MRNLGLWSSIRCYVWGPKNQHQFGHPPALQYRLDGQIGIIISRSPPKQLCTADCQVNLQLLLTQIYNAYL